MTPGCNNCYWYFLDPPYDCTDYRPDDVDADDFYKECTDYTPIDDSCEQRFVTEYEECLVDRANETIISVEMGGLTLGDYYDAHNGGCYDEWRSENGVTGGGVSGEIPGTAH